MSIQKTKIVTGDEAKLVAEIGATHGFPVFTENEYRDRYPDTYVRVNLGNALQVWGNGKWVSLPGYRQKHIRDNTSLYKLVVPRKVTVCAPGPRVKWRVGKSAQSDVVLLIAELGPHRERARLFGGDGVKELREAVRAVEKRLRFCKA